MRVREIGPAVWAASGTPRTEEVTAADRIAVRGAAPWRAQQLLGGRALLRALLSQVLPQAAGAPVVAGPNGKPFLHGRPRLGISISHDDEHLAVCVGADRRVGVDIQLPPDRVGARLLRRCARGHLEALAGLSPRRRDTVFAEIWTVQEACVKADGSGIGGLPWTIDVPPHADRGSWQGLQWRKVRGLADAPMACAWDEESR
ncbi:4'-phosphopantetheinyl transferase family protein [Streptomyces candidus]|uniref:4'-phosphopantetheinyl transferase n=1 Tax=Streptomyces candidus TaxID=67283 RepID=A0A7X0HLL3_9ACTN|nr:4'-phosphopantetheinyl transferase superfamily protein [Streptomyces candidus]MBB6438619.1 4'-phosphopantetheinyl transferase [Streptomyces candidus]GHH45296.1 hypothetical protein GCM10018773_34330 [Streptomyces candidus]